MQQCDPMTYNEQRVNIMEEVHAFYAVVLFGTPDTSIPFLQLVFLLSV
jgi:hypothetical protein